MGQHLEQRKEMSRLAVRLRLWTDIVGKSAEGATAILPLVSLNVSCLCCFEKLSLDTRVALVDGRLSSGASSNPALLKLHEIF